MSFGSARDGAENVCCQHVSLFC